MRKIVCPICGEELSVEEQGWLILDEVITKDNGEIVDFGEIIDYWRNDDYNTNCFFHCVSCSFSDEMGIMDFIQKYPKCLREVKE